MARQTIARVLLLICFAMLAIGCSDTNSPEAEIRAFIASAVEAAESRDSADLAAMIHPDYQDAKGYNRKQLGSLLRAYFNLLKLLEIHLRSLGLASHQYLLLH